MFWFWSSFPNQPIATLMVLEPLQIGTMTVDPVLVGLVLAGLAVLALLVLAVVLIVHLSRRKEDAAAQDHQLGEMRVRLQTLAEISVSRHGELARAVNERLDRMTHKVGTDLNESSRKTHETMSRLNERLAVIDTAQKNLTELSSNMVSLQEILANKQARGAFGQMRMEAIIKDGLPAGAYTFQATLSNNKRPDCLLHMPNTPAGLVIDAKFPLEGFEAFRAARTEDEKKYAARRIRTDVGEHIKAMAEKYFIAGETQDTAILFVPSESISADLAEHFPDILQKALSRAHRHLCAEHADACGADHAGHPQGRADARAGPFDPTRSRNAHGGHGPVPRPGPRLAAALRPGQCRYRQDPHLGGQDHQAWPEDRAPGF